VASCRAAAREALAQKDYERFHDLAWLAYRKGKPDDAELMLLLARAQSLSGRPGDAIVMLQRLEARGAATDVATSEDFEAVRLHPRWKSAPASEAAPVAPKPPPSTPSPEVRPAKPEAAKPTGSGSSAEARSAKAEVTKPPAIPPAADVRAPKGAGAKTETAKAPPPKPPSPLSFTTLLSPSAVAYDAVSKRYLIADKEAKRIAVIDQNTGQVSTLAGAQARLGEINGMAIDPRQGDLWIVTSSDEGASLGRLQLISGRQLAAARVSGVNAPIVAVAFARNVGVVVADRSGDIYRVSAAGRAEKLASLEYVPTALVADAEGTLYVAAGGQRIARYSASPFRRLGIIDLEGGLAGLPFTVVGDTLHLVVPANGAYEIRTVKR
jgi:hypothetical protein